MIDIAASSFFLIALVCVVAITKSTLSHTKSEEMLLNIKINNSLEEQYMNIVNNAVIYVENSYVKPTKKSGKFNEAASRKAKELAIKIVEDETTGTILEQKKRETSLDIEVALFNIRRLADVEPSKTITFCG